MKKVLLGLVGLALVGGFVGTFVYLYQKSEEPPVVYETVQPFESTIVDKTVATGSVVPRREIAVKPNVSGIIEELYVEPGVIVEEGDLVAKVRIIPDMASLASGESRVNRARIALENAEKEFRRNQDLFEQGVVSESLYLQFDLALKQAREEVLGAEDSLAVVREGARRKAAGVATNTLVLATARGMILEVPVEEGDSVIESNTFNDGTTIATIADMDEMIFEGLVDESEVGKIREGMDLVLTIGAIESRRFDAVLEYISPKGVEENGAIQFEIRAALAGQDTDFIRANYSANADIVLARVEDVLAVRESWVQFDEGRPYVEVESSEQSFEKRFIETGLSDGITVEIVDGVEPSDKIKDPNSASA